MSFCLRTWLLAVILLFVAEDFQYMLKIGATVLEQTKAEKNSGDCTDCDENEGEEGAEEKEEKKEEKKEKDEDQNTIQKNLLRAGSRLAQNKFRDALFFYSDIAHELESPPPEV